MLSRRKIKTSLLRPRTGREAGDNRGTEKQSSTERGTKNWHTESSGGHETAKEKKKKGNEKFRLRRSSGKVSLGDAIWGGVEKRKGSPREISGRYQNLVIERVEEPGWYVRRVLIPGGF